MEIKILKKGLVYAPIQNKIDEPELKRDFEGFVRQTRLSFMSISSLVLEL